jgi:cellulose synthase/poly-beta-1,6-N-acetylglucosamine synthase-like glycosyltransferase
MSATDNPTTAAPISAGVRRRAAVLHAALRRQPRRVSAMLRVKNDEEFLAAAVRSIIDSVDEVVLVDNGSTDATPKVIAALRAEFPDKVVVYGYPYEIASSFATVSSRGSQLPIKGAALSHSRAHAIVTGLASVLRA